MAISFYGTETAGSISDRKPETAKQETTGSVGVRQNQEPEIKFGKELEQDTVCFRAANPNQKEKSGSAVGTVLGVAALAAAVVGGLGFAHKYNVVSKIKNDKVRDFLKHAETVTKPCYDACVWVKKNCYQKVVDLFKK